MFKKLSPLILESFHLITITTRKKQCNLFIVTHKYKKNVNISASDFTEVFIQWDVHLYAATWILYQNVYFT